jgi:hypothetical protein
MVNPSRRSFLATALTFLAWGPLHAQRKESRLTDPQICRQKFSLAQQQNLHEKTIGEIVIAIGASFIGTPYAARTLEVPGPERLVVNLRGLDCVTFVESTLALARCIARGEATMLAFESQLQRIRYRRGVLDEYPSRLHYFCDWIHDNDEKKTVRNMTEELGGERFQKNINFMSTHRAQYGQLSNGVYYERILDIERAINRRGLYHLPKEHLARVEDRVQDGDIIGITTTIEGLDISHTGIAVRENGVLKYLHAPLTKGKVQVTNASLTKYLAARTTSTGIMVARPLHPGA